MPAKQIPDLEWKFKEEVQLIEPVLIQIYHLPEQSATTENDRPERQHFVEAKKTENQDTKTSQGRPRSNDHRKTIAPTAQQQRSRDYSRPRKAIAQNAYKW